MTMTSEGVAHKWLDKELPEIQTRDLHEQQTALEVLINSLGWKLHLELLAAQIEQRNEVLDFPISDNLGVYAQEYVKGEKMALRTAPLLAQAHLDAIVDELESRKPLDLEGSEDDGEE